MNKTVALVNLWGAFEEQHPRGTIEDFCRHFLAQQREIPVRSQAFKGDIEGVLLRTMGRIAKITTILSSAALEGSEVKSIEEAGLLLYVAALKQPKKSEAIYQNLLELSSGVDMLNRLVKRGLLREYPDTEDRRSKRMEVTPNGMKAVEKCQVQLKKLARMLTKDMSSDNMALCLMLIKGIDDVFTPIVLNLKNKGFEAIYKETVG